MFDHTMCNVRFCLRLKPTYHYGLENCLEYENQIIVIKLSDHRDIKVPLYQSVLNLNRLKVEGLKNHSTNRLILFISHLYTRTPIENDVRMTYLAEEKVIDKVYIQQPSEVVCCEFIYRLFGGICNNKKIV